MNIFFYAVQETTQALEVLHWLESLRPPLPIDVLPSAFGLHSEESMGLRNGDLLIIFVQDQKAMETLVDSRTEYNNYKIYLIFQEDSQKLIKAGSLLNPRHYSSVEKNYIYTEETIRKILKQDQ